MGKLASNFQARPVRRVGFFLCQKAAKKDGGEWSIRMV